MNNWIGAALVLAVLAVAAWFLIPEILPTFQKFWR